MNFLGDLLRWFWSGNTAKNDPISQAVSDPVLMPVAPTVEKPKSKNPLDIEPLLSSKDLLGDLQSLQSLTQQFEHARHELIAELQRLAPPKKRNPFWNKDAA